MYADDIYGCNVLNADLTQNNQLTIGGVHRANKANDDVKFLTFYGSQVTQIPQEFLIEFPNIEDLRLDGSLLSIFNSSSLQGAEKLKNFHARTNQVTRLEADSLQFQPMIMEFYMQDNWVDFVDEKAFRNKTTLETIGLYNN